MANYKISESAKADLARIYLWGLRQFGEAQADRYYDELFACFERIGENPQRYPQTDLRQGYRRCVTRSDTIYYRITDGIAEIMAIIGQQDTSELL